MQVQFYEHGEDAALAFAVIVARYQGKWLFVRHKERTTIECPGGHREKDETIEECAKRELWEESGALEFDLYPICVYSVIGKTRVNLSGEECFGMLYYGDIKTLGELPNREIGEVLLMDTLPAITDFTYPQIQPRLIQRAIEHKEMHSA